MKFQKYLKRNMYKPYRYHYLDYEILKSHISPECDEQTFRSILDENFSRVFGFIDSKKNELSRRVHKLYKQTCTSRINLRITQISEEMRVFSEFIRINVVGFKRILKKNDKKNTYKLMPIYKERLKEKIRDLESLDDLIYNSSKVVLKNSTIKTKKESGTTFIRRTDKYWVHKDNIHSLKFFILQHLPIYVYSKENSSKSPFEGWDRSTHDTRVSSVYLDNSNFDLYSARIHKIQNAEAIRIRWYGATVPEVVFIERKRHEESWTGETSKKLRFKIPERMVGDFLEGRDVWEDVRALNGNEVFELYREVQEKIVRGNLRPVVRTYYKRQAFQLPNDSRVRLSLDTELCMIKESGHTSWRREDVNTEYPFPHLSKSEIVRFPHAILEIKTQGVDETKPEWINELVEGPLIEHVHKFSKYLHGCAVLYPFISEIPYWLPQMTTSIKKDPFDSEEEVKEFENSVLIDIPPKRPEDSDLISPIDTHGKKIAIPVRVEPKVFFANERTFLSWVQFAIFLGGIGTAMLGLGEQKSTFSGVILISVSVIFSFYSLYLYLWRAGMIRKRHPGPYDDIYGPPVLVCVFLLAMAFSIIYKFPLKRVL